MPNTNAGMFLRYVVLEKRTPPPEALLQDQATDALTKWRRFHTRAKIDDLVQGLEKIRRMDVVDLIERQILQPKRLLHVVHDEVDPRKKEIEDLNRKLNKLFEKMRTGVISSRDTYVYSTIGLDPLRPVSFIASLFLSTLMHKSQRMNDRTILIGGSIQLSFLCILVPEIGEYASQSSTKILAIGSV